MAFAWFMAYWIKFIGLYVLLFPIRMIRYLYLGIRYNGSMADWITSVRVSERVVRTLCTGIAAGLPMEELKEFMDEVNKILHES